MDFIHIQSNLVFEQKSQWDFLDFVKKLFINIIEHFLIRSIIQLK